MIYFIKRYQRVRQSKYILWKKYEMVKSQAGFEKFNRARKENSRIMEEKQISFEK